MMDWPKPLTGLAPIAAWLNRLLAKSRTCTPLETPEFRIEFTTNGYCLRPKFRTSGGPPGKSLDANYKLMIITGLGSALTPARYDLLICREWSLTTGAFAGSDTYVAKDIEARRGIVQEYYLDNGDNIKQNYTYFTATQTDPTFGDNFRLATDGTNSELQVMEKRYITKEQLGAVNVSLNQALIYVVDTGVPTGVKDPTNADVTRIEVKPFREWSRYATQ